MKIEDIRLTPEEIRAAHSYWNDISDNAVKRVKVVTDTATQKAIEKIVGYLEANTEIALGVPMISSRAFEALKELVKK